jgi:aspartyl-tRNA(Asn)/glutamyl-tRNA(Gln) amidotransferase subunit A
MSSATLKNALNCADPGEFTITRRDHRPRSVPVRVARRNYHPAMGVPDVTTSAAMVRSGQASARELVTASLEAVAATQDSLNTFSFLHLDGALAAADAIDRARAAGDDLPPLAGVPFGVKDLEDCAGMPTTRGSRWYADAGPAERDDLHVERLRRAGAIPIGKTTTPEFGAFGYTASPLLGVTRNPWNLERTPGGSSGGTAAAVSAGTIPFGTASDGGGSIRGPAASCGLPGLKPTYGRVPAYGVTRHAQNAVNFALATTIADTALLFDAAVGPDMRDRTSLPTPGISYLDAIEQLEVAGLRAAWSADLGFVTVDPEVAAIAERAAVSLVAAASLATSEIEVRFDDFIAIYAFMESADQFVDVPAGWEDRLDELDPLVVAGWRRDREVTLPKFAKVEAARRRLEVETAELFEHIDVLLTPTNPCPPFAAEGPMPTEIGGRRCHAGSAALLTMFANVMNLPAMSVPAGLTADGLPIGLMITARRHREDLCLRLARIFEQAAPWPRVRNAWASDPTRYVVTGGV